MWSDMVYMIPIASVLSIAKLEEDTELKGDLQEELIRLIDEHFPSGTIEMVKNEEIISAIDMVYPKGTNIWTILDTIMATFDLTFEFKPMIDKRIRFMLIQKIEEDE